MLGSCFNSYQDARGIATIGDAVAGRIATFVKDQQ